MKHLETSTRNLYLQSGQVFSLHSKPFILLREEGVTVADSVETPGVDLSTRVKKFRCKRKSEEEEIQGGEVLTYKEE